MAWRLPVGFDKADGVTPLPPQPQGVSGIKFPVGVPDPAGDLTTQANNADVDASGNPCTVAQPPDCLPEIERAEQATYSSSFRMIWKSALSFIGVIGRGTFVTDSFGNVWRILSAKLKGERGGTGTFTLVGESISFDSPPDDYQMTPSELGLDIIKYPRYFYALYPTTSNPVDGNNDFTYKPYPAPNTTVTRAQVMQGIIRAIQTYRDSPQFPNGNQLNGLIQNQIIGQFNSNQIAVLAGGNANAVNISGDAASLLAVASAGEIIQKLWYQIDTPYIAGFEITWSQYYFAPVYENPGGYIENPVGIVPDYFISPDGGVHTIFDQMAAINPQCYSSDGTSSGTTNISWLRKADEVDYQRTWFKVTRKWIGSPVGHWDLQIYSGGNRPSVPTDYLPLV